MTPYWTATSQTEIEICKSSFARQIEKKEDNAKRLAKKARDKKTPKKSDTKSRIERNVSVEITYRTEEFLFEEKQIGVLLEIFRM